MLQLQDFLGMDSENFRTLLAWRCLIAQKKKENCSEIKTGKVILFARLGSALLYVVVCLLYDIVPFLSV